MRAKIQELEEALAKNKELEEKVEELEGKLEDLEKDESEVAQDKALRREHDIAMDQLFDFLDRECVCEEVRTIIDRLTMLRRSLDPSG